MNKYEMTVVISAKLEEEGRTAELDKVKAFVEKLVVLLLTLMTLERRNSLMKSRRCQKVTITSSHLILIM